VGLLGLTAFCKSVIPPPHANQTEDGCTAEEGCEGSGGGLEVVDCAFAVIRKAGDEVMKRTWGMCLLLAGLGGCVYSQSELTLEDMQRYDARPTAAPTPANPTGLDAKRPSTPAAPLDTLSTAKLTPPARLQVSTSARPLSTAAAAATAKPATLASSAPEAGKASATNAEAKPDPVKPEIQTEATPPASATPEPATPPPPGKVNRPNGPMVCVVNSKRVTLNYEVKDIGPSGVSAVELWYTHDCKEWKKHDVVPQANCYVAEVEEEGMYGFTLLARSGIGLGKEVPHPGDLPQVWVLVDLTKPDVQLGDITPGLTDKKHTITVQWKAHDENIGHQPISLFYSQKADGPWQALATNLENTGRYLWQVPQGVPSQFYVRVEARDLAGNVGAAQTANPVLLDTAVPSVAITTVEPGNN
jgi:hypothetical protein